MDKFATRGNVLIFSAIVATLTAIIAGFGTMTLCLSNQNCSSLFGFMYPILFALSPLLPLILLTYVTNDSVFQSLKRFLRWWIPISLIILLLTPETTGSAFVSFIGRGQMAIILASLFTVISLILIAYKSWKLRVHEAS